MKNFLHKPIKILQGLSCGKNSKMSNITSKYFNIFNYKAPTSCITHKTGDFMLHVVPVRIPKTSKVQKIFHNNVSLKLEKILDIFASTF